MNAFEINKIIAAIILAVLLFFGVGKLADFIFYVEKPKEPAYKIEAPVIKVASTQTTGSGNIDVGKLLSLGTVEHGEKFLKNALLVTRLPREEKIKSDLQFLESLVKNRVQLVIINTQKHYWLMEKLGALKK